jgi:hypothetical protein
MGTDHYARYDGLDAEELEAAFTSEDSHLKGEIERISRVGGNMQSPLMQKLGVDVWMVNREGPNENPEREFDIFSPPNEDSFFDGTDVVGRVVWHQAGTTEKNAPLEAGWFACVDSEEDTAECWTYGPIGEKEVAETVVLERLLKVQRDRIKKHILG